MSTRTARDETAVRRLAEAAAWRVRLSEDDAETSEAFERWMADPANEAAWDQVQAPWREVGEKATSPELMAARAGALARAHRQGSRRPGPSRRFAAAIAAVVVATAGLGSWAWFETQPQVYRTTLGERRVVPLPDGSKVSLDSGSKVRIRFTKDARRLELIKGQARFDVAKDVTRPFSVTARDQTVVATGTAFNVDMLGPKVLVTLIEGHVVVVHEPPPRIERVLASRLAQKPAPIQLEAGEQLVVTPAAKPVVHEVSLERATSWETGQLTFADEPLASVAERVSRYAERPIEVAPDAARLRVSGVFRAGDVDAFVDMVTHYLPVEATRAGGGEITLRSRG
ncbi:MAG TPA: FecR domain-containing protein [Caulobacteraceae bacterium]